VRLAYVAATRARDLLVVPALGDEAWEGGWFSPLNRALYPPMATRRQSERGPKCPAFKSKDSVLQRPNDEPFVNSTVCPGQHTFGEYSVVWWEPGPGGGLVLDKKPTFGVRREDLIVKDVQKNVIADGRGRYDRWHLARDDARAAGAVPSMVVESVRDWTLKSESDSQTPEGRSDVLLQTSDVVTILTLASRDDSERPGGTGFGLLVHALLAHAAFGATRHTLSGLATVEARVLGLTDEDAAAAASVVERLHAHELLVRARAAEAHGACRRETPITCTLPDGTTIEGIVDLAFEEQGRWTVVDYKTDRELAAVGEDRYRRQVALYASAIAQATGQPATGVLIRV
jgi:ATP-dependent exoDNAse (exonuclease V) beta subunit